MPTVPFTEGLVLSDLPQSAEDREFARSDLERGCRERVYEEITREEAYRLARNGHMISSAFTVWQGDGSDRKGRFVVNFKRQSKHWQKGSIKMETLQSFAVQLQPGDHLMSWDIKSGYRHFYLHPAMRNFFLFRYEGRYYRCIALPFGWGRSVLWFTKLMRPLVQRIREKFGYRLLPYIDDFACAPSPFGRPSTSRDCARAGKRLTRLFKKLGLVRHPEKGCWEGTTRLEHLGCVVDTVAMKVFASDAKVTKLRNLAKGLLLSAQLNRRLVSLETLRHFCGVAVSMTLAMPLSRFYTRSLYFDMTLSRIQGGAEREERGKSPRAARLAEEPVRSWGCRGSAPALNATYNSVPTRVRLCRQSLRDLQYWRRVTRGEGRDLVRVKQDLVMHSDAADVGYGGTLGHEVLAGSQGLWEGQGFWTAADRSQSITLRELRAVRLLLQRHFAAYVSRPEVRRLLLHEDNMAVCYILNAMTSASKPMMVELRRLQAMMRALGVQIEARWLPSAVNRFADALSRTWDPGDVQATTQLLRSIQEEHQLDSVVFASRPLGETSVARRKYLTTQMQEHWGDGRSRLWNPPFDLLPLVVRKVIADGGKGVLVAPHWPAQAWHAQLVAHATRYKVLQSSDAAYSLLHSTRKVNDAWSVVLATMA